MCPLFAGDTGSETQNCLLGPLAPTSARPFVRALLTPLGREERSVGLNLKGLRTSHLHLRLPLLPVPACLAHAGGGQPSQGPLGPRVPG